MKNESLLLPLGLRIERLLYVALLIILSTLLTSYFVMVSINLVSDKQNSYSEAVDVITKSKSELELLYSKIEKNKLNEKQERTSSILRKNLGLLPPKQMDESGRVSYKNKLTSLIDSDSGIDSEVSAELEMELNSELKSPDKIIDLLKVRAKESEKITVDVLGIESPKKLKFKYGETDYSIKPKQLAWSLLVVLIPLIGAWQTAFISTRRRELNQIYSASSLNQVFPHTFNIFPVRYETIQREMEQKTRRNRSSNLVDWYLILYNLASRLFLLLILFLPITGLYGLCHVMFYYTFGVNFNSLTFWVGSISLVVFMVQVMAAFVSEYIFIRSKIFYV